MKHSILFAVIVILFLAGCQKESSIVSPNESSLTANTKSTVEPNWQIAAEKQGLRFIQVPASSKDVQSLSKRGTCTKYAEVEKYTYLSIAYKYKADNGNDIEANVSLTIQPNSLEEDQWLTMSFTDKYLVGTVDLTFGPHGTSFLKPALLNVTATGMDFNGLTANDKIALMYFNESTGNWEAVPTESIEWDINSGYFKCINGQLPHFSRYGFTRDPE